MPATGAAPGVADSHYNSGFELQHKGRLREAVASYRAALAIRPGFFEAHVNLANALQDLGDTDAALVHLRQAAVLQPQAVDLYLNIGAAMHAQGRYLEAADTYRKAMQRSGPDVRWFNNLGMALREARHLDEAIAAFRDGLSLCAHSVDLMEGLASALQANGQLFAAADMLREAVALQSTTPRLLVSLAGALLACGRVDEALSWYQSAVRLEPSNATAHSCLLFAQQYSDKVPQKEHFAAHRSYAERFEAPVLPLSPARAAEECASRRLRIGYVSADLRSHSVAYFIEPVLQRHDRSQFEVTCYFVDKRADAVTARLRALADRWRDCAGDDDARLAQRIRDDGIDILVDLSGHTGGHRLGVFARRPA
ncbi:MAG TPA: tetratricopeptide repeat protein, partial [Burkholderiaceae bacterium]|nr:tetratricopeptide repeat protein [Burkholderiaceae bacterium]